MTPESPAPLDPDLDAIAAAVQVAMTKRQGDSLRLLHLLRLLEHLHRAIQEGPFAETLPTTRHDLYALLQDIETQGGWPYIYRRSLHSLMANLLEPEA